MNNHHITGFGGHTPVDDPGNNGVTLLPFSGVNNINAPLYIQRIVTELGLDPNNPEHDAMFAWLNDENNEAQAVELFNFMYEQGYSAQAVDHIYEILISAAEGTLVSAFPFVKCPLGSNYTTLYPKLTEYLKSQLPTLKNNSLIINKIVLYGDLSAEEVKDQLEWGKGPIVDIAQLDSYCTTCSTTTYGLFQGNNPNTLFIDQDLVNDLETTTPGTDLADSFAFLVGVTILHEFVHYSEYQDASWNNPESGKLFEVDVYGQTVWRSNADIILKKE